MHETCVAFEVARGCQERALAISSRAGFTVASDFPIVNQFFYKRASGRPPEVDNQLSLITMKRMTMTQTMMTTTLMMISKPFWHKF